jgi:hypothetical protein
MIERLASFWSSKRPKKSKIWQLLSLLLTIAMLAYLAYAFTKGKLRLSQVNWKEYYWAIVQVLVVYFFSLVIQFFVWTRIISHYRKATWLDVEIYARMILMRSLPGGAWHWVGRISMYSGSTDVPTRVVVLGNFLEWALLTLSGAGIYCLTLPIPALGIALAVLVFGAAFALGINWQPDARKMVVRITETCMWLVFYCFVWLLVTVILFIILRAIAGSGQFYAWEILRASTMTGSLGLLISMLPSSLGVREISLVWLLQAKLTPSVALLVALMLRIIYALADVIWGMMGWSISRLILRKKV